MSARESTCQRRDGGAEAGHDGRGEDDGGGAGEGRGGGQRRRERVKRRVEE